MDRKRLEYLFDQYDNDRLDPAEKDELFNFLSDPSYEPVIRDVLEDAVRRSTSQQAVDKDQLRQLLKKIGLQDELPRLPVPVKRATGMVWTYAASIIAILGLGIYTFFFRPSTHKTTIAETNASPHFHNDVPPPSSTVATLTLADGSTIMLDPRKKKDLQKEGAMDIVQLADGSIAYRGAAKTGPPIYNSLNVPKGSKPVQLILEDGSRVWLNSQSSITYPIAFTNNERRVQMMGEAYFEITQDAARPFIVDKKSDERSVRVLGTHFNINAYDDEGSMDVSLLEGSVAFSSNTRKVVLKPGQQGRANGNGMLRVQDDVNMEGVMAWKDGRFYFDNSDIRSIMREISRWYNIEVDYKDDIPYTFVADISKNVPLSEFLKLLEMTDLIHFSIDGNKVTVMK